MKRVLVLRSAFSSPCSLGQLPLHHVSLCHTSGPMGGEVPRLHLILLLASAFFPFSFPWRPSYASLSSSRVRTEPWFPAPIPFHSPCCWYLFCQLNSEEILANASFMLTAPSLLGENESAIMLLACTKSRPPTRRPPPSNQRPHACLVLLCTRK